MGHYDECRPGYCATCGAGPGNLESNGGVCPFCHPKKEKSARSLTEGFQRVVELNAKSPGLAEPPVAFSIEKRLAELEQRLQRLENPVVDQPVASVRRKITRKMSRPNMLKRLNRIRDELHDMINASPTGNGFSGAHAHVDNVLKQVQALWLK